MKLMYIKKEEEQDKNTQASDYKSDGILILALVLIILPITVGMIANIIIKVHELNIS